MSEGLDPAGVARTAPLQRWMQDGFASFLGIALIYSLIPHFGLGRCYLAHNSYPHPQGPNLGHHSRHSVATADWSSHKDTRPKMDQSDTLSHSL